MCETLTEGYYQELKFASTSELLDIIEGEKTFNDPQIADEEIREAARRVLAGRY